MHEPSYLVLYSQCQEQFPSIAQHLPKPDLFSARAPPSSCNCHCRLPVTSIPARQPWAQRTPAPPAPLCHHIRRRHIFFRQEWCTRSHGCMFCGMLGHRIHGCPAAEEYYRTGRVKIISNRLHLPTGEQIPNDGRRLGLKASLDAWLAANTQPSSNATMLTPQRDPPPHITSYSFEISPEPAVPTSAYIVEEADSDLGSNDNAYTSELYDMYEVFAMKKKDSRPSKVPAPTQADPTCHITVGTFAQCGLSSAGLQGTLRSLRSS